MAERRAPPRRRLSAADWAQAAYEVLRDGGVSAVAVEPLARRLGVTKGSFYWHFADREALLKAALERWEDAEQQRLARVSGQDPRGELGALLRSFATGEGCLELRASDGERDAAVASSLARVSRARAAWIGERLHALGYDEATAAARALIAAGSLVGLRGLRRAHAVSGDELVAAWLSTLLSPAAAPDNRS